MSTDGHPEASVLPPDTAFSVLGNETRMEILQVLAEAGVPLEFSELHERVAMRDSGQFNYHLDQLVDHFVEKTADGYALRQAGRRIVEAVLSGAVTEAPIEEPTPIENPCPVCGGQTVVAYYRDKVEHYCTHCEGFYDNARAESDFPNQAQGSETRPTYGYIGSSYLPPAGIQGRAPSELFQAAAAWLIRHLLATASGACPRCSADLEEVVRVCEDHESEGGVCDVCQHRQAIQMQSTCDNCYYEQLNGYMLYLLNEPDLLESFLEHDINPVAPSDPAMFMKTLMDYDEELVSTDPFEARFRLTIDGTEHQLSVTKDVPVSTIRRS